MSWTRCLLGLTIAAAAPVVGQDSGGRSAAPTIGRDLPAWAENDTNLVHPSWFGATVPKNILLVSFKLGATPTERRAAIAAIHGEVVAIDTLFWIVRVVSHPNACGVRRAMERLANVPAVRFSGPDMVWSADNHGGLHDLKTPNPTKDPCPAADSLLR